MAVSTTTLCQKAFLLSVALFVFVTGIMPDAQAQVGNISRLAHSLEAYKKGDEVQTTDRATLERVGIDAAHFLTKEMELFIEDLISVNRGLIVDMKFGKNQVVGAPEFSKPTIVFEDRVGLYQILRGTKSRDHIEVVIGDGVLLADINPKEKGFTATLAEKQVDVIATKVLFEAQADISLGSLYLKSGKVVFRDHPTIDVKPGERWSWQAGGIPYKQNLTRPQRKLLNKQVKYLDKTVWSPSLIKQPLFWVAAVAVVGSTTCAVIENCRCTVFSCGTTSTGSITITGGF